MPESVLAEDPGERMRQRLLVSFGVLLVAFTVPWYLAMFALDPAFRIPRMTALGVIALVAGAPFWLRVASTRVVAWGAVVLLHVAIFVNVALNNGLDGPTALALTCLPVLTAVLLGSLSGWIDFGLIVLFGVVLEYLPTSQGLPTTAPPEIWRMVRVMSLGIGMALMMVAVTAFLGLTRMQSRELRRLAHHDGLTGLFNRHFVAEILPSEIARLERRRLAARQAGSGRPCLGFVLIDLDYFKQVNDTWGHSVGDQVLQVVGNAISKATRSGDVVARWGGEEFFVVLRDLDFEDLAETPQRILRAIRDLRMDVGAGNVVEVTCSVGFTHIPFGDFGKKRCCEAFVKLAGFALLKAKQEGRDRGLGYLWTRDVRSAEDVERVIADVSAALGEGVIARCDLEPAA